MRVLFVDNYNIAEEIIEETQENYIVDRAVTGKEGMFLRDVNSYDAILIDYYVSDLDLEKFCRTSPTYTNSAPIAVITQPEDTPAKIDALIKGADRAISPPDNYLLLDTIIKSMVTRNTDIRCFQYKSPKGLCIDFVKKEVSHNGKVIKLRKKEYDILEYLILNKGRVLSKDQILEHIWHPDTYTYSNTIEVHIRHIRDKIDRYKTSYIETVRGFGYKFTG